MGKNGERKKRFSTNNSETIEDRHTIFGKPEVVVVANALEYM